jgi:hypothetical protein
MPKFTIDLTAAAVAKLQAIVARHNADNGTALTVADWVLLNLKEIAIGEELGKTAESIRRQAEDDANAATAAAIRAERDRLLASLGGQ